jgi:hypothetical protein
VERLKRRLTQLQSKLKDKLTYTAAYIDRNLYQIKVEIFLYAVIVLITIISTRTIWYALSPTEVTLDLTDWICTETETEIIPSREAGKFTEKEICIEYKVRFIPTPR